MIEKITDTTLRLLLDEVIDIARQASDAILAIYQADDYDVARKADDSPITIADHASNEILCKGLAQLNPSLPIISEENTDIPYETRKSYKYCWLIDPLDGTREFVNRTDDFVVNIALIYNQKPILGVVACPMDNGIAWAIEGHGAYYEKDSYTCRLRCRKFTLEQEGLTVLHSRSHLRQETVEYLTRYINPKMVSAGSALKFLKIAGGEADVYPRLGPTMEWDTAAPQIIVEEAGGSLLRIEDELPMYYNKPSLLNPHFITYATLA